MSVLVRSSNGLQRVEAVESRDSSRFSKRLKFYHQATVGDTGISLSALIMPSVVLGKVNPSPTQLGRAKLLTNRDSLSLRSTARGFLEDGIDYQVTGDLQIQFLDPFVALDGEAFIGTLEEPNQFGTVVADALSFAVSTELAVGATDVVLPYPIQTNALVGSQLPAIAVVRNGTLQRQNPGNNSSALSAGNYYLVDPTNSGFSTLVRFNDSGTTLPSGSLETVDVYPVGVWMFSASDGALAALQSLGAQTDKIASVLAETAGVPATTFQANPNYQDLRQFGDQVLALQTTSNALQAASNASGTVLGVGYAELTTAGAASTTIPGDDTIPQITEGTEILTLAYTPKRATSHLIVEAVTYLSEQSNTGDYLTAAIFRDTTVDAIGAGFTKAIDATGTLSVGPLPVSTKVAAGSTAVTTFRLRVGNNGGSVQWNGDTNGRRLGGAVRTVLKVTEIIP